MGQVGKIKRRPDWFGNDVRPAWGVLVRAEIKKGIEGTAEQDVLHNGLDWCDRNGAPLPGGHVVLRWRHRDWKSDGLAQAGAYL